MSHVDDGTLHAYLDGELSPPEAQGVEAHVAQCPVCRERLEEERALIARASELLSRAAPPDRDLPPFRLGDLQQPVRLWWQVRLPLAWAATIALALGVGTYLGEHGVSRSKREVAPEGATAAAVRLAPDTAPPAVAPARDTVAAKQRQELADSRVRAVRQAAPANKQVALAQERADTIRMGGANTLSVARQSMPLVVGGQPMAAKAAAPEPTRLPMMKRFEGAYAIIGGPISVDSAHVLLGQAPLGLPGVPIRAIYRGRMIGYSGLVIIEQALDSTTILEVINGRAAPLALQEVVVTGAATARPDSQIPGDRALLNARVADSIGAASRPAPAPAAKMEKAERAGSGLFVDVRGPVAADSLAALRRLLRPVRP